ncbi:MAG: TVP38/TMEM64 family protein [Salinirussus sp.]
MNRATRRQLLGAAGLVAVAVGAALLLSPETVIGELEHLATHPLQFILALAVVYLARPFLFWPVSSIAVVLGYLYDPAIALPVALVGAGLTGLPPFAIARYADSDAGFLSVLAAPARDLVGAVGAVRGVVGARFSPVPGDVVSYGAGLSDVSVAAFLVGTVIGEVPWALAAVFAGNSMRTLTVSGFRPDPWLIVGIAAMGVLLLGRPLYRHLRGRRTAAGR